MEYKKQDININNYKYLLDFLSKNYNSFFFHEFNNKSKDVLLMRHDIDYSIENSVIIAQLEKSYNIKSTFFVNIHSDFYNFFEKKSLLAISKIIELGHSIGIHFDSKFWDINEEKKLEEKLSFEKSLIDSVLGIKTNVFSFHNPNQLILSFNKNKYSGLINTYSSNIMNSFKYCSDSNGHWRHEVMFEVVNSLKYDKLHLLTHPGWWTHQNKLPRKKIFDILKTRSLSTLIEYDNNLSIFKRENIGDFFDKQFFEEEFSESEYYDLDHSWYEKNYFQLLKSLLNILEKNVSEIKLITLKEEIEKHNSQTLETIDVLKKIELSVRFIHKINPSFQTIGKRISKIIELKNISFYKEDEIKNLIKRLISLIKEVSKYKRHLLIKK